MARRNRVRQSTTALQEPSLDGQTNFKTRSNWHPIQRRHTHGQVIFFCLLIGSPGKLSSLLNAAESSA